MTLKHLICSLLIQQDECEQAHVFNETFGHSQALVGPHEFKHVLRQKSWYPESLLELETTLMEIKHMFNDKNIEEIEDYLSDIHNHRLDTEPGYGTNV
jgi:hypothetical protein